MTIQDLINELKVIQKEHGDLPVLGACDEEQNCLGDVFQVQVGQTAPLSLKLIYLIQVL